MGTPINGPLNLENFIMPLRFHWKQIHDIVILGNSQLIGQKEWDKLKNFPRIFIVHVSLQLRNSVCENRIHYSSSVKMR